METEKDSEFLAYGLGDKLVFLRFTFMVLAAQTFLAIVLGAVLMMEAAEYISESEWLVVVFVMLMLAVLSGVLCLQDLVRKGAISILLLLLLTGLQTAIVTYVFVNLATFLVIATLVTMFAVDLALCVYAWTTQDDYNPNFAYGLSCGVAASLSVVFFLLAPEDRGLVVALSQACVIGASVYIVYSSKSIVMEAKYTLQEHDFVYASLLIYAVRAR